MHSGFTLLSRLILALMTLLSFGCAGRFDEPALPVETAAPFSASGEAVMPDSWWTAFGDEELNRLVQQALSDNFTLKTAWERLRAAQALAERESALQVPSLDFLAQAEAGNDEELQNPQLELGLSARYEVDLWGRIGQAAEAERFRAVADFMDYRTAAVTLSAQVVETWFRLMEAWSRHDLLLRQQDANEKILRLIRVRFAAGLVGSVDVLRQEQLIEENRQQVVRVESDAGVLEHQLAVLVGRAPQEKTAYRRRDLPALPPLPAAGLPAALTRRRPDIQRAYFSLAAADRDMAVAVSDRYPRITLTGSLTSENDEGVDFLEQWSRSLVAGLVAPLFDAGRRSAEVERTRAVKRQRLYEYTTTILEAFREVEDALLRETKQADELQSLRRQLRLAQKALERIEFEYLNGVRDYIDVLTTLRDEQQLRRDLISATLLLLEFRSALYRSLAGGFATPVEADAEQALPHRFTTIFASP